MVMQICFSHPRQNFDPHICCKLSGEHAVVVLTMPGTQRAAVAAVAAMKLLLRLSAAQGLCDGPDTPVMQSTCSSLLSEQLSCRWAATLGWPDNHTDHAAVSRLQC